MLPLLVLTFLCRWNDAPFAVVMLICWLWGSASGWFDIAAVKTMFFNFPQTTGLAAGLIKAFQGLATSLIGCFYYAFIYSAAETERGQIDFVLFLAVFLASVGVIAMCLSNVSQRSSTETTTDSSVRNRFFCGYAVVCLLALFYGGKSLGQTGVLGDALSNALVTANAVNQRYVLLGAGVLNLGFLLLPLGAGPLVATRKVGLLGEAFLAEDSGAAPASSAAAGDAGKGDGGGGRCSVFATLRFWFLFINLFMGMGTGLVLSSHVSQVRTLAAVHAVAVLLLVLTSTICRWRSPRAGWTRRPRCSSRRCRSAAAPAACSPAPPPTCWRSASTGRGSSRWCR